jgi:hypothetical protein
VVGRRGWEEGGGKKVVGRRVEHVLMDGWVSGEDKTPGTAVATGSGSQLCAVCVHNKEGL